MRALWLSAIGILLGLCAAVDARAQSNIDAEFAGAGARALAMGQAFIGLSDDSTSVTFNPAGLLNLERPEMSSQALYTWDNWTATMPTSTIYENLNNLMTGEPVEAIREEQNETRLSYSFASFVYPTQKWCFAISEQTLVDMNRYIDDYGYYQPTVGPGFSYHTDRQVQAQLRTYGLTAAYLLTEKLWVGATGHVGDFNFNYREYTVLDDEMAGQWQDLTHKYTFGFNVGVQYMLASHWTWGAVYRAPMPLEFKFMSEDIDIMTPQIMGTGLAYHPNDKLRLGVDIDHVKWSQFVPESDSEMGLKRDDILRYHGGGEYLLGIWKDAAWFLRGGLMYEPSNLLYYEGQTDKFSQQVLAESFPKEGALMHYTCGLGMAREKFQIDFALDLTDEASQAIFSTIIYF